MTGLLRFVVVVVVGVMLVNTALWLLGCGVERVLSEAALLACFDLGWKTSCEDGAWRWRP